jgi:hypothetical protein
LSSFDGPARSIAWWVNPCEIEQSVWRPSHRFCSKLYHI